VNVDGERRERDVALAGDPRERDRVARGERAEQVLRRHRARIEPPALRWFVDDELELPRADHRAHA
jgi:hypothetical protein